MQQLPFPRFLRQVLLADAAAGALMALPLLAAADALSPLLGLPAVLLRAAALLLLPVAAFVAWTGTRPFLPVRLVWCVIAVNLLWVADSAALLLSGHLAPTMWGQALVIVQAAAVALFAELEYLGLRRARRSRTEQQGQQRFA
ncbi:MAG TPA: hypothetical protein VEC01_02435 [Noviherbaspirillum sp.]|uniref:hypothetical protein n=1 Tax=Noviherbaspirillum sp. TaxID=1926288 RepID=UPI002D7332F1|nr:hypothetical protein [Noviherbaspirillum sp.]HYD94157.1 hypothetical protein [Noviherbaspirillum sp.]